MARTIGRAFWHAQDALGLTAVIGYDAFTGAPPLCPALPGAALARSVSSIDECMWFVWETYIAVQSSSDMCSAKLSFVF